MKQVKDVILGLVGALLITAIVILSDQLTRANEALEIAESKITVECNDCPCSGVVEVVTPTITIETPKAITTVTPEAITKPAIEKPKKPKKTYTKEDFEVLSKVIEAEVGGQSKEIRYYTGAVVLNRVRSKYWANTVKGVVFQKGQYACTWDGNYKKAKPSKSTKKIAKDLLENGVKGVPRSVVYQSSASQGVNWKKFKCTNGVTIRFDYGKWDVKAYGKSI